MIGMKHTLRHGTVYRLSRQIPTRGRVLRNKFENVPISFESQQFRLFHYNIAIVGSGPSGCYTAKYLQSALSKKKARDDEEQSSCTIHILERLPTPYGLVRYGVAPDHPEVKNVQNDFDVLFQDEDCDDDSNSNDNNNKIEFWGNITVGETVSIQELRVIYDIVVLAYGCESDKKLPQQVEGEEKIEGILSAREFVAWYNGHPEFNHIGKQVERALASNNDGRGAEVVIIGIGNVALDCGRILIKGHKALNDTDITSHALSVIDERIHKVTIIGRRGHVQAKFTIKELREFTKLDNVSFHVQQEELDMGGESKASANELTDGPGSRPKKRIDKLLRNVASATIAADQQTDDDRKNNRELHLRFLLSPRQFETKDTASPSSQTQSSVTKVICERTKLVGDPGVQTAVGTGEYISLPAQLVLVSIGYKGLPLPGLEQYFDYDTGIIQNNHGKVLIDEDDSDGRGKLYVSGWLKRGPSGIIGTNIPDAKDTVQTILQDLSDNARTMQQKRGKNNNASKELLALLTSRNEQIVKWSNYQNIVSAEASIERKRSEGQPREKITNVPELLKAAAGLQGK